MIGLIKFIFMYLLILLLGYIIANCIFLLIQTIIYPHWIDKEDKNFIIFLIILICILIITF